MSPAREPRAERGAERLLCIDPAAGSFGHACVRDLPGLLRPGDLLVLNDAATLPASLPVTTPSGAAGELRLASQARDGAWWVVLFGAGDWRTPTEHRPPPDVVSIGDVLTVGDVGDALRATVVARAGVSPRLVAVRFDRAGADLWAALYRAGRAVQYAYTSRPLELWDVQTGYASRPWAVELPSAGRPLTWDALLAARRRGIRTAVVTHAAGLSATGDPALDAALPLPERYDVPAETVAAVVHTRAEKENKDNKPRGRVVAVGTSVVRALEGCAAAHGGALVAGAGETDLVLGPGFTPRVVDGLLTGIHEPTASHFQLLHAFAPADLLARAYGAAAERAYLCHEFGDANLILPGQDAVN